MSLVPLARLRRPWAEVSESRAASLSLSRAASLSRGALLLHGQLLSPRRAVSMLRAGRQLLGRSRSRWQSGAVSRPAAVSMLRLLVRWHSERSPLPQCYAVWPLQTLRHAELPRSQPPVTQ